jgi:hypothetical protein
MAFTESKAEIDGQREDYISGIDSALFAQVGAFICFYSLVEANLTAFLGHIVQTRDFERLDFLTRGMDAKAKVERLFSADPHYVIIGDNLKNRLERFKSVSLSIRNVIAHTSPRLDEAHFHFISLAMRSPGAGKPTRVLAPHITLDDFTRETLWLHLLAEDLAELRRRIPDTDPPLLEIDEPLSDLPKEGHPPPLRKGILSKPHKPPEKPPSTA